MYIVLSVTTIKNISLIKLFVFETLYCIPGKLYFRNVFGIQQCKNNRTTKNKINKM